MKTGKTALKTMIILAEAMPAKIHTAEELPLAMMDLEKEIPSAEAHSVVMAARMLSVAAMILLLTE